MDKQYEMLKTVLYFHKRALSAVESGVETSEMFKLPVREEIARAKYIPQSEIAKVSRVMTVNPDVVIVMILYIDGDI